MATNKIAVTVRTRAPFTLTLAGLADGSARQSTMISNTAGDPAALVFLAIKSGAAAPTVNKVYEVYLLRGDGVMRSDGAGASDAALTVLNAALLGTIVVTASANTVFYGDFDTSPLGPLGPEWGIAVKNVSGQALSSTEGDHTKSYTLYVPDVLAAA